MNDAVKMAIEIGSDEAISFLENACRNWSRVPKLSKDDVGDVARALTGIVRKYQPAALEQAGEPVAVKECLTTEQAEALSKALSLLDTFAGDGIGHTYGNGQTIDADDTVIELAAAFGIEPEPGWWRIVAGEVAQRLGQEFDAGEGLEPGQVQWHSSEEDGGPDVGIMIGLGGGKELWLGELLDTEGGGMGFSVYGPEKIAVASLSDWEDVRDIIEQHVAPALAHPPRSRVADEPVGLREAKASFKTALADLGKRDAIQWWGTEDSQHAERMKACKARCQPWGDCDEEDGSCAECDSDMAEALETTASMKRRLRNYEARADRFFQSDGLRAVQSILASPSQPDPQSRGQAFDGEGEARTYHADDCEAMLRPRADCTCAPLTVTPGADAEMRKLLDLIETADEHGDECAIVEQAAAVRSALSSAKRGKEG